MALTIKQEKFCQSYVEKGNASEAYRLAYNAGNMKKETINTKAKELLKNGPVAVRIKELQKKVEKRHDVTVDSLIAELEEIKQVALNALTPQTSAAVSAVMGKARLTGLDKQVVDNISSDRSMSHTNVVVDKAALKSILDKL